MKREGLNEVNGELKCESVSVEWVDLSGPKTNNPWAPWHHHVGCFIPAFRLNQLLLNVINLVFWHGKENPCHLYRVHSATTQFDPNPCRYY